MTMVKSATRAAVHVEYWRLKVGPLLKLHMLSDLPLLNHILPKYIGQSQSG